MNNRGIYVRNIVGEIYLKRQFLTKKCSAMHYLHMLFKPCEGKMWPAWWRSIDEFKNVEYNRYFDILLEHVEENN